MTFRTLTLLSAATLSLAACGHKTDTTTTNETTTTDSMNATDANMAIVAPVNDTSAVTSTTPAASGAQAFVNTAAASDAFEIATSKLAATQAGSAAVKTYAAKMIAAHEASTAKLKATTATLSPALTPDPTLSSDQQAMLDALKPVNGADFDKAYATDQTAAHQATLDALKAYVANGDQPKLKEAASGLIPVVTEHLAMAKTLK